MNTVSGRMNGAPGWPLSTYCSISSRGSANEPWRPGQMRGRPRLAPELRRVTTSSTTRASVNSGSISIAFSRAATAFFILPRRNSASP